MKVPILAFLQGLPESIAMATLVMSLGADKLRWKPIIYIGLMQGMIAYLVRLAPLTPGVHVIILITILATLGVWLGKIDLKFSVIYSAITMAILIVFELAVRFTITSLGLFTLEEIDKNIYLRIITGYPQIIALFLLAFLVIKIKHKHSESSM